MTENLNPIEILEGGAVEPDDAPRPSAIPPDVWDHLQQAGSLAAERLHELLAAPSFTRLRPSDQIKLIDLALVRAYGPPIKREVSLALSGDVSDAVAESLGRLAAAPLPEMSAADPSPRPARRRRGAKSGS